jgi:hypothetical protein
MQAFMDSLTTFANCWLSSPRGLLYLPVFFVLDVLRVTFEIFWMLYAIALFPFHSSVKKSTKDKPRRKVASSVSEGEMSLQSIVLSDPGSLDFATTRDFPFMEGDQDLDQRSASEYSESSIPPELPTLESPTIESVTPGSTTILSAGSPTPPIYSKLYEVPNFGTHSEIPMSASGPRRVTFAA